MMQQGYQITNKRLPGRLKAFRFLFWQLAWCWLCLLYSVFFGVFASRACLLAFFIVMIPQLLFVAICFLQTGAVYAKKIVNLFYIAELTKLLLTGFLLLAAFKWVAFDYIWFFSSYIGAVLAYFWVPLLLEGNI